MSEQTSPAIRVQGLTKAFGRQRVLRELNLVVERGDFVTLLGPNVAGKTTLIRILATLSRPTQGQVWVHERSIWEDTRLVRAQVGLVSHQTFLYGDLTAEENLRFYGRMYGVPHLNERIAYLLERVGLYERRHDRVRTFSRGMQQRLSIVRAILHDPPILLLDEPDTGLDQQATRMLGELLGLLGSESRTILMTTHHLERALEFGRRVAILCGGQISYESPTAGLSPKELASTYMELVERRLSPSRGSHP